MIEEILHTIASAGAESLEILWFPAAIWIILSAIILGILYLMRNRLDLSYHYHLLCSLLLSLPMGIVVMQLFDPIISWNSKAAEVLIPVFIVQSPLAVAAPTEGAAASSPELLPLLLGVGLLVFGVISIVKIGIMLFNIGKLGVWEKSQAPISISSLNSLSASNKILADHLLAKPAIYFDRNSNTPFTFGFLKPAIVLPYRLQRNSEKMNMAIRHELLHMYRGDYLLNLLLTIICKLFWFIPLVKHTYRESKTYRELSCDNAVLSDPGISEQKYAELLFELAPQNSGIEQGALSMSVKPSMLKKRIKIMEHHKPKFPSLTKNFSFLAVTFLALTLAMSCTDMQNNATVDEEELSEIQTQTEGLQIESQEGQLKVKGSVKLNSAPLYIIDGVEMEFKNENNSPLNELNPENIKSIEVLKEDSAVENYGEKARNGVVIITTKQSQTLEEMEARVDKLRKAVEVAINKNGTVSVRQ